MEGGSKYRLRSRREQLAWAKPSGADSAEHDLRAWAGRYEAEAHTALHAVFPNWVTPPSAVDEINRKRREKEGGR